MRVCTQGIFLSTFVTMFVSRTSSFAIRPFFRATSRLGAMTRLWLSTENDSEDVDTLPPMANLYREWSLDQDRILWNNKERSSNELAALLGRGIRGVEARLSKLQDVSSPAYERLFAGAEGLAAETKEKLVPVGDVLRRIEWDYMLQPSEFSILHYDRLEDKVVESSFTAPNNSVAGEETLLAKALPEHRIVGVKYKERIVWDRNARLDLVFNTPGIYQVMETYDEWKLERDRVQAWNRQRQLAVAERVKNILGMDGYEKLQQLSSNLLQAEQDTKKSVRTEVEKYVQHALELFRMVRSNPSISLDPLLIPTGDYYALDELSELVAVLPNINLRGMLLLEISTAMNRAQGSKKSLGQTKKVDVELVEDELTESFVRGSGPGGQKINKTSNRVLLVHEPTQLRVECQDTRSLQQNRKIARKRLKEKLDEYLNGNQSKLGMKHQKASIKREKSKTKNRSRLKKKQLEKQSQDEASDSNETDDDFYQ